MKSFLRAVAVTATALALVLGTGVLALRAGLVGPGVAEAAGPFGPFAGEMPPELQWLKDLSPAERFAHFYGVQVRLSDEKNQTHTVALTPGTITEISSSSLKLKTNESGEVKTYNLTGETRVRSGPQRLGASATPKAGDQVVVVTIDGRADARAILVHPTEGFGPRRGR